VKRAACLLLASLLASSARAQPAPPAAPALPVLPPFPEIPPLPPPVEAQPEPPVQLPPAPEPPPAAETGETGEANEPPPTVEDLQRQMNELQARLDQTREIATLRHPIVTLGGYLDIGFFVPQGTGVGVIQDEGPNRVFPQYANRYAWVFLGDLLAPTINSRGEAASLGNFPGVNRFDSVDSTGAPSFIANEVNLRLDAAVARNAIATASLDFMPRSGHDFSLGDFMEVDLAQLEWLPGDSGRTSIFVGKFESVVGIEYRDRKSTERFGVTPSLIARYTTGTPLGIKVRSKLGESERVVVAAALTNGSSTTEQFHFYDEIDSNAGKTASGRLSVRPFPSDLLEVGLSGEWGPQDHALDSTHDLWFWGIDLLAHVATAGGGTVDLKGQFLKGGAPGQIGPPADPTHEPYGLKLRYGGYLELDWMATPLCGFLLRGEVRDADIWLGDPNSPGGAERLYITREWRVTAGVRVVVNQHIAVKAEYLHNGEYGGIPQIPNDVFTSSLVLSY
jgi:hypothetical protein